MRSSSRWLVTQGKAEQEACRIQPATPKHWSLFEKPSLPPPRPDEPPLGRGCTPAPGSPKIRCIMQSVEDLDCLQAGRSLLAFLSDTEHHANRPRVTTTPKEKSPHSRESPGTSRWRRRRCPSESLCSSSLHAFAAPQHPRRMSRLRAVPH